MRTIAVLGLIILLSLTSAAETLKIGVVAPLSGEFSAMGRDFVDAIRMAAAADNLGASVDFTFTVEDDSFQPSKGLTAVKKLLELDKVNALINLSTPTMNSVYPVVKGRGLPVLQFGLYDKSKVDDNVFMLQPEIEEPIKEYGRFLFKETGGTPLDVFYFEDASVLSYVNAFVAAYGPAAKPIAVPQISSLAPLVLRSAASKPGHVVMGLTPEFGTELIRQYLKLNLRPQIYSLWSLEVGSELYRRQISDQNYLDTLYFLTPREPVSDAFLAGFRERYGRTPQPFTEGGYDAVLILARSFARDGQVWLENIKHFSGTGVSGSIRFNPFGERVGATKTMRFGEIKTGVRK